MDREAGLKDFPALLSTIQKNKDTAYINGFNKKSICGQCKQTIPG